MNTSTPAKTPGSGGIRTRMSSAARREQIIEMAVTAFAESGIEGTSVEELAASAGVSKPLIYGQSGSCATLLSEVAAQVEHIFIDELSSRGFDGEMAPMYASMLVGMVALTGQWWLDARTFTREDVAAHIVNLAWNGLSGLESRPRLSFESRIKNER